jgi:hypothetical protein
MAILSKTALVAKINTLITTNGNNDITGAQVNEVLTDIVDSTFNAIDDSAIEGNWVDLEVLESSFDSEASNQATIKIYDLPAGGQVEGTVMIVDPGDEFTGGVISAVTAEVGIATVGSEDAQGSLNVHNPGTAPANINNDESTAMYDWDNPTEILCRLTATGGNLQDLTNGRLKIKLKVSQPK